MSAVLPRRRSRRKIAGRVGWNALGLLVFVVMVFPVYWMISTSFKTGQNILSDTPQWFPSPATLANYRDAIDRPYFWDNVKNSVIIVCSVVAISLAARVPRGARAGEVPLLRAWGVHRPDHRRCRWCR